MRTEKNEISRREYKSPGRQSLQIETSLETILDIHKIEIEGYQEDPIGLKTNLETYSGDKNDKK